MKKYIEKLQQKSYSEKSSFAFMTSLILTGIIAAAWFFTIFANSQTYFKPVDLDLQNLANTGSLFDVFKESVK